MSKWKRRPNLQRGKRESWQLQEAKARFSELVNEVTKDGYQTITKNGHPVVVVISIREFEKLQASKDSILDFFLESPFPELDLDMQRDKDTGRDIKL